MQEKEQKQVEYRRIMQDIEEAKQYIDDYEEWQEGMEKADKSEYVSPYSESVRSKESEMTSESNNMSDRDISFYEAFDRFQAYHDVSENDGDIFYGSVFQEFNEQWQGKRQSALKKPEIIRLKKVDFSKLSLEERAKLLLPPTADQMAELKGYQKQMGYNERKMKSMKYKMAVYDEFLKEYDYRKKHCGVKESIQKNREIGNDDFARKVIFILLFIRNIVKIKFLATMLLRLVRELFWYKIVIQQSRGRLYLNNGACYCVCNRI